ncbi:hypothetical protein [Streptomyces sp. NBC_00199]|nr:hypothetical protein [Streptomyces sp. NBC_00199]MCX5269515.1 hypothetical protein [Streptomyces sp. NBC_00199]
MLGRRTDGLYGAVIDEAHPFGLLVGFGMLELLVAEMRPLPH